MKTYPSLSLALVLLIELSDKNPQPGFLDGRFMCSLSFVSFVSFALKFMLNLILFCHSLYDVFSSLYLSKNWAFEICFFFLLSLTLPKVFPCCRAKKKKLSKATCLKIFNFSFFHFQSTGDDNVWKLGKRANIARVTVASLFDRKWLRTSRNSGANFMFEREEGVGEGCLKSFKT